jgi:hypothetical protein
VDHRTEKSSPQLSSYVFGLGRRYPWHDLFHDKRKKHCRRRRVVKKIVLATTMSTALLNTVYASSLPNCGDREALHTIQELMKDTAHKQIDSMGDIQLAMTVTALIQQLAINTLANTPKTDPTCVPDVARNVDIGSTGQKPRVAPGQTPLPKLPTCPPTAEEPKKNLTVE